MERDRFPSPLHVGDETSVDAEVDGHSQLGHVSFSTKLAKAFAKSMVQATVKESRCFVIRWIGLRDERTVVEVAALPRYGGRIVVMSAAEWGRERFACVCMWKGVQESISCDC
jgi:hypothetical protein